MRRCARVLSATALAGAALGVAAPAASADPATEVRPRSVAPGGAVPLSVSCDATGAERSDAIEAGPQSSEETEAQLRLGGNDDAGAAADNETARIPSDGDFDGGATGAAGPPSQWEVDGQCPVTPGGQESQWTALPSDTRDGEAGEGEARNGAADPSGAADVPGVADAPDAVNRPDEVNPPSAVAPPDTLDAPAAVDPPGAVAPPDTVDPGAVNRPDAADAPDAVNRPDEVNPPSAVVPPGVVVPPDTLDAPAAVDPPGTLAPPGTPSRPGTVEPPDAVNRPDAVDPPDTPNGPDAVNPSGAADVPPGVQRGAQAGEGGAFTGSIPALVTGSVLVAVAIGAACYRVLRRKGTSSRI